MSQKTTQSAATLSNRRRYLHPTIAAVILLLASAWWLFAKEGLKWALVKKPVPWPSPTVVDSDFRLESMPQRLGQYYYLASSDPNRRYGSNSSDGTFLYQGPDRFDGTIVLEEDLRHELGVGAADAARYKDRESNWYFTGIYRDRREPEASPYAYWQLEITYYTGSMDPVPHTPDRCLAQAGAKPQTSHLVHFTALSVPAPWNDISVNCAPFLMKGASPDAPSSLYVQYYVFSMNGTPETSREFVRLGLTNPLVRYSYFAKIQFAPRHAANNLDETTAHAEDFYQSFISAVAANLPTAEDIKKLDKAD